MDWWLYVAFMLINALICPISVCEPRSPTFLTIFQRMHKTLHCRSAFKTSNSNAISKGGALLRDIINHLSDRQSEHQLQIWKSYLHRSCSTSMEISRHFRAQRQNWKGRFSLIFKALVTWKLIHTISSDCNTILSVLCIHSLDRQIDITQLCR